MSGLRSSRRVSRLSRMRENETRATLRASRRRVLIHRRCAVLVAVVVVLLLLWRSWSLRTFDGVSFVIAVAASVAIVAAVFGAFDGPRR